MADMFDDFDDRLQRIESKKGRLKRGYALRVDRDGLIVARPRSRRRGITLKGMAMVIIGFFAFKALLIAYLGTATYEDRVKSLREGASFEQVGAWFMESDPLSSFLAGQLRPYVR